MKLKEVLKEVKSTRKDKGLGNVRRNFL